MVSGCPSQTQVTVVAGEPVEIQVRVDDMYPWVNPRCVILGGSGEEMTHSLNDCCGITTGSVYMQKEHYR